MTPPPHDSPPATASAPPKDLRVRRTRRLLAEALVELTRERPFETITARDLTDRAEIGYATFFRHYSGTQDLLRSVVDDLVTDLHELLPPLASGDPQRAGAVIFRHARDHADLYMLLLRTDRSLGLLDDVIERGVDSVHQVYARVPNGGVPVAIAAHHFIHSFVNLIEWWLEHDMPYDPDRMAEIYLALIHGPTEAAVERPPDAQTPDGS